MTYVFVEWLERDGNTYNPVKGVLDSGIDPYRIRVGGLLLAGSGQDGEIAAAADTDFAQNVLDVRSCGSA